MEPVTYASRRGRLVLAATVTASGVAFLDTTVVNVALPRIGADLGGGFATLQWVLDAYLLTLGALVLVGGALGDQFGRRRVFEVGLVGFGVASLLCGLAPNAATLIGARALQGVTAALLVPGSLAILSSTFDAADRGRAIGAWSGLAGIFTALGPFVGGALVDASASGWRFVFLLNLPLVVAALILSRVAVPDVPGLRTGARLDLAGAALVTVGLGLVVLPLIEWAKLSRGTALGLISLGAAVLVAFVVVEARSPGAMLPLSMFGVRTFTVANPVTFTVYAALGGAFFLLVVTLQEALARLGAKALKSLLVEASAQKIFVSRNPQINDQLRILWEHSVAVGSLARDVLALTGTGDSESAYVAGLLHDVGKPIVAAVLLEVERSLTEVYQRNWIDSGQWLEVIAKVHRTVGVALGERWQLPPQITASIRDCGEYDRANREALVNAVCFGNALAKKAGVFAGAFDAGENDALVMIGRSVIGVSDEILRTLSQGLRERTAGLYA